MRMGNGTNQVLFFLNNGESWRQLEKRGPFSPGQESLSHESGEKATHTPPLNPLISVILHEKSKLS